MLRDTEQPGYEALIELDFAPIDRRVCIHSTHGAVPHLRRDLIWPVELFLFSCPQDSPLGGIWPWIWITTLAHLPAYLLLLLLLHCLPSRALCVDRMRKDAPELMGPQPSLPVLTVDCLQQQSKPERHPDRCSRQMETVPWYGVTDRRAGGSCQVSPRAERRVTKGKEFESSSFLRGEADPCPVGWRLI